MRKVNLSGPKKITHLNDLPLRQRQVATGIAIGLTIREIALQLGISPKTVESHRRWVYISLQVNKNTQIVDLFYHWGLFKVNGTHRRIENFCSVGKNQEELEPRPDANFNTAAQV